MNALTDQFLHAMFDVALVTVVNETVLFPKAKQKPLPRWIIVFDLQVHDGADPGEV